jgi:hypothetical protein
MITKLMADKEAIGAEARRIQADNAKEIDLLEERIESLEERFEKFEGTMEDGKTPAGSSWTDVAKFMFTGTVKDPMARKTFLIGILVIVFSTIAGTIWLLDRHPTIVNAFQPATPTPAAPALPAPMPVTPAPAPVTPAPAG